MITFNIYIYHGAIYLPRGELALVVGELALVVGKVYAKPFVWGLSPLAGRKLRHFEL